MSVPLAQERPTLTVPEAAAILGISQRSAYSDVKTTGTIGGVKVLRSGSRIMVPTAALRHALCLDEAS